MQTQVRKRSNWLILCFVFILSACSAQRETKEENTRLKQENDNLKSTVEQKQKKYDADLKLLRAERDSLRIQLNTAKSLIGDKSLELIDSLEKVIVHKESLLTDCHDRKRLQDENIGQLRARLRSVYHIQGNEAQKLDHNRSTYDCYTVDLKKCNLQLYWKHNKTQQPIRSLGNLEQMLEQDGQKSLVFATNAGMYTRVNAPQGLYIQNGKVLVPVDRRKEEFGNFYVQPNGIFLIDTAGVAKILITDQYNNEMASSIRFATQSGPMVVVNGVINAHFKEGSDNLNIRSGVGILPDGRPVFVISNQPVNFYDFASVFNNKLKCQSALYLDGAISLMYLPETGRFEVGGNFGPIIGVTKK
ncbi:MAG: phosphodiester glycosidase family protein [Saprospiraceae bacterium]|jgi:uncharacterized protein YigE (DUF2233 family)